MMTMYLVLAILALISTAVAAWGKCPVWVPVFMLSIIALIHACQAYGLK